MHHRAMAASVAVPQCPAVPCSAAGIISGYTSRKSSRASAPQLRRIRPAGASPGPGTCALVQRLKEQWSVDLANWIMETVCGTQNILLLFLGM